MHLCYLCDEYPPGPHGGIGSMTQTIGRAMAARGHRVTVVGIYDVPRQQEDLDGEVRVVRLPHTRLPLTGFFVNGARLRRALAEIHATTPIDVIEGPELAFALLPRSFPATKIIRLNGGHHFFAVTLGRRPRPWRSWLERRSFARADHLCAVSQFVVDATRPLLGLPEGPVDILPNPIDTDHFAMSALPAEEGLIVFVGTLCDKKGVRELVQALPIIRAQVPGARLLLVGRDTRDPATGESYAETLRRVVPPEHAAAVEFAGHVSRDDLPGVVSRAAVAVFPSHMESQGIVIGEAMATGRAVVTSAAGPGPEIVEHGTSGLLCDPHDPRSIATHVVAVLTDAPLRARMGRAARERTVAKFSKAALAERTESFYVRCTTSRPPRFASYALTSGISR